MNNINKKNTSKKSEKSKSLFLKKIFSKKIKVEFNEKKSSENKKPIWPPISFIKKMDSSEYEAIKSLPKNVYDGLPEKRQRKFMKTMKRILRIKRKQMLSKYSKAALFNKKIVYTNEQNKTTKNKQLNTDKFAIQTFDLSKSYFSNVMETPVLKNININIRKGLFISIFGQSGSGKTTLLNLISGLDYSSSGDVLAFGVNLSVLKDGHATKFRRDNVGFIFQQYNLLANLTVEDNIAIGANLAKNKDKEFIDKVVETIGLKDHIKKFPYQLSGGQQQRVSIARAISKNPRILFCDEPTGALDEETGKIVLKVLKEINRKFKTTIVIVTHNKGIAKISDEIINLRSGNVESIIKNKNVVKVDKISWS